MATEADKVHYNKLTNFLKKINLGSKTDSNQENEEIRKARERLVPRLPEPSSTCTLEMEGGEKHEIPIYKPVHGPLAIDGVALSKAAGMHTYDPGFTSTASCVSGITFIDGDKG